MDSLGQGDVSLVVHSEADAWGSATGKEEEGDPAESHEWQPGRLGCIFVSHYLSATRQTGDEENESGPSAQNPAAQAPLAACLTSR